MPNIVFASPKGGAGKSTSAVLLVTQLAGLGVPVTLVDADPNKPLSRWAKLPGKPDNLAVVADVTEESIIDAIEGVGRKTPFVIRRSRRDRLDDGRLRHQPRRPGRDPRAGITSGCR